MSGARIIFKMPDAGESPIAFRYALLQRIRAAIAWAALHGRIDLELADEAYRALPLEESRQ
jgi:hypothetical protein